MSIGGTYEPFITVLAIPFRDVLQAKGYDHAWKEWHEGHSPGSFLAHVDNAMEFLIPANPTGVQDDHGRYLAKSFELFQNYPNPFNPTTVISFQLPVDSDVTLAIYNVSGQLVKQVASGRFASGRHSVAWDAKDDRGVRVASGIYLYHLRAGGFTQMRKMSLLR